MNLKFKVKIVTSLLKNWPLNICCVQIQWGFFSDALPFYSAGSWVCALSGSAAGDLKPSEYLKEQIIFIKTCIKMIIPMKNRKGHQTTALQNRAMHEQVVTRA